MFWDFDMDVVPERIFEEILTSVLDECFPESHWATKESFVRRLESKGCVDHFINRTCKVYNISVVTCYFLERILIPSPCNNFGCLSSQVSCGRAYPRTAKPWRLSSQFEQNRISWLDVFTIFCYNTVIPLNKLTCLGQQNINLRIRNESSLIGKKHTTLYTQVLIFGAACISLRRPIFIFKDLTNVIFGIGSTEQNWWQCLWKMLVIILKNVDFRSATYFYINSTNPAAVVWNNVGFFIKWCSYSRTLVVHC